MDDVSEDSDTSERIWIKVTAEQARQFCGLDDTPVAETASLPAAWAERVACGVWSGEEREIGPMRGRSSGMEEVIERSERRRCREGEFVDLSDPPNWVGKK